MCGPAAAVQAAAIGFQFVAEEQQARAAAGAQRKLVDATAEAADASFQNAAKRENLRVLQAREASGQEAQQIADQRERASARARVISGEAGRFGQSSDLILADIQRQGTVALEANRRNLDFLEDQSGANLEALRIGAINQVRSVQSSLPTITPPNLLATGFKIAGSSLEADERRQERIDGATQ